MALEGTASANHRDTRYRAWLAVAQAPSAIIPQVFHVHKKTRNGDFTRLSDDSAGQAQPSNSQRQMIWVAWCLLEAQVMHAVKRRTTAPYKIPLRQILKGEWMPGFRLRACLPIMGPWR